MASAAPFTQRWGVIVWEPSGIGLTFVVIFILGYWVVGWKPGLVSYQPTNGSWGFGHRTKKNLTQSRKGAKKRRIAVRKHRCIGFRLSGWPLHRAVVIRERNR